MKKCPKCQFEQQYSRLGITSHAPGCTYEVDYYYTAPSDEAFENIKLAATMLWSTYDDTHGYASEKINRINDIFNRKDNYAFIVKMFDSPNQDILYTLLTNEEAKDKVLWLRRFEIQAKW